MATNTSFNLPQYDEHNWQLTQQKFPFNVDSINYKSPSLPLHFNRSFLPKNLCEAQLLNLSQCLMLHNISQNDKPSMCTFEFSHFEVCRRHRDLRILQGIQRWEQKHMISLDKQNRGMYQMGLNRKLDRLQNELERQPSTVKGIEKAKQLQAEIKELKWRLDYIGKTVSDLQ